MLQSWRIGQIGGIDLYLHPTFLFVLTMGILGGPAYLVLILGVFACVLLHEYGHALMARQFGIETEDITLSPIGGVARLRRMPRAPGAEILIALAGPSVNLVIALLIGVGLVALEFAIPSMLETSMAQIAQRLLGINLMLALFNLIPAFPMDGGRVVRAILSSHVGRLRATEIAAGIGQTLAVVTGLVLFALGGLTYWLQIILAVFIYWVAGAELAQVRAEESRRSRSSTTHDPLAPPPGYSWIYRGNGVWQLAPVVVEDHIETTPFRDPRSWI